MLKWYKLHSTPPKMLHDLRVPKSTQNGTTGFFNLETENCLFKKVERIRPVKKADTRSVGRLPKFKEVLY